MLETILFGIVIMLQYLVSGSSATPMMGAALAVVSLGSAALALPVMGRRPRARELGLRALVMLALGGMLYGLVGADNKIAASRAGRIAYTAPM